MFAYERARIIVTAVIGYHENIRKQVLGFEMYVLTNNIIPYCLYDVT